MKKSFFPRALSLFFIFQISVLFAGQTRDDSYRFSVDLRHVKNDMLHVKLVTPQITSGTAVYHFPAMVPGTYSIYDFGRFIQNMKAYDEDNNELTVTKKDVNSWEVSSPQKLYALEYDVEDTYDSPQDNPVFEPVGTNIELDTNYVINNHGFFGYFDGYLDKPYMLDFTKPEGFYGATSLDVIERSDDKEQFRAANYNTLVDNPIMFSHADTSSISIGGANIMFSVYSPSKSLSAPDISKDLKELLNAIKDYLGGTLPTDRYNFIFYFAKKKSVSGANGALEHNTSSMYYMPDLPVSAVDYMLKQLVSTCAHEFMHIVTPLNLHSEEIGNFDFNNPKMSEHLWLYEGVTEYSAHYIQLRQGLTSLKEYVETVNHLLQGAARFNDTLAFTELSLGALDKYQSQYSNVYQKGALIGMCLDILIRSESGGSQGLKDVINKLLEKYGKQRSFKDADLFGEFTALTSPKVADFFARYVAGSERLPFAELFPLVGLEYKSTPFERLDYGEVRLGFNQSTYRMKIVSVDSTDEFVKTLGIRNDDDLVSVNGKTLNFFNIREAFGSVKNPAKVGDDFEMEVARTGSDGKENIVKLNAKILKTRTAYDSKVTIIEHPTEEQMKLLKSWAVKQG